MAGIDQSTLWKFASMVLGKDGKATTAREQATFLRVDQDGTQWVRLPGSNDETPVNGRSLASAKPGDMVEWSVEDGRLSIVGNSTSPSVGMRGVDEAVATVTQLAEGAYSQAEAADASASAAQRIAEATAQHVWTDTQGLHVTYATKEQFQQEPTGPNQLSNAYGIVLRDAETWMSAFTTDGMTVYDGQGNDDGNAVAEFSGDGARVGYKHSSNVSISSDGMVFNNYAGLDVGAVLSNGGTTQEPLELQFLKTGQYATYSNPVTYTFVQQMLSLDVNHYEVAITLETSYSPDYWNSELVFRGSFDTWPSVKVVLYEDQDVAIYTPEAGPSPNNANSEESPLGNDLLNVIVEVKNAYSGLMARLSEDGPIVTAVYNMDAPSYRFGRGEATGDYAFSEGSGVASGNHSHAQNKGTIAASSNQTSLGRYNIADGTGQYAVILGNGSADDHRSNALTVDWQGNIVCRTVNGIDIASAITGVAQFQGELDSQATLEAADYEAGWFWVVTRSGTYAGNACEQGDMVYAVADRGEAYADSDFVVAQANLGPTTNLSNIDIDQICV